MLDVINLIWKKRRKKACVGSYKVSAPEFEERKTKEAKSNEMVTTAKGYYFTGIALVKLNVNSNYISFILKVALGWNFQKLRTLTMCFLIRIVARSFEFQYVSLRYLL